MSGRPQRQRQFTCLEAPQRMQKGRPPKRHSPWVQTCAPRGWMGLTFCRGRRLASSSALSMSSSACSWLFHLLEVVASWPPRAGSRPGLGLLAGRSRPNTTGSHSFSHLRRQRLVNCRMGHVAWRNCQHQGLPVPALHVHLLLQAQKTPRDAETKGQVTQRVSDRARLPAGPFPATRALQGSHRPDASQHQPL